MKLIFNRFFILSVVFLLVIYIIGLISFDYYLNEKLYKLENKIKELKIENKNLNKQIKNILTLPETETSNIQSATNNNDLEFDEEVSEGRSMIIILMSFLFLTPLLLVSVFVIATHNITKQEHKIFTDIIGNLTHEFNTPLTSIKLISEMIYKHGDSFEENKLKNYALIIQQETDKLLLQSKLFLNSAINEEGDYKPKLRLFNIHGIIEHTVKNTKNLYNSNDIEISLHLKANDDNCMVDRNHMINIITNLLENSKKYSKRIPVKVEITTRNEFNKLFIEIADNGIGIEENHLKHIFKKFYRVNTGNLHDKPGYGVGLYYVKTTLNQMNADINVKSKLGEGTKFTIELKNFKNIKKL